MKKIENTIECIEALMKKMNENNIKSLNIKENELEIFIETDCDKSPVIMGGAIPQYQQIPAQAQPQTEPVEVVQKPQGNIVKAPIVGTFYSSASPKDKAFVSIGEKVKKGDVLFIIESMKVMNEVKSEFDGTVTIVNVKDGEAVEFDQPLMIIE